MLEALPLLLERGGQLAVLGSGEPGLESAIRYAAASHPGRVVFRHGYDEPLSHRIVAGSDLFAVPSRFEPCGLTQMYAMTYGTVPIVRHTGGLADTVSDATSATDGVGFVFAHPTGTAFGAALERALDAFADPSLWRELVHRGMQRDFGWSRSAIAYESLYEALVQSREPQEQRPGHEQKQAHPTPA